MKHMAASIFIAACSKVFCNKRFVLPVIIFCSAFTQNLFAQAGNEKLVTVKGYVTNQSGQPVADASITTPGGAKGTTTKPDGSFQLIVPPNSTLVISYVGYASKEIRVGSGNQLNFTIQLTVGKNELDQVIVVGYGTRRKSDVTGAISSISEQSIRDVPSANLSQALKGQGAGIDVQKSGGNSKPGAKPTILIRGTRSINASNAPLIVVDGIPFNGDINDLNPDDIVSVDVLKDASSTAIYGSRGANGVILVTTRRGKNGIPVVTYSGYAGFVKNFGEYDVMNAQQFEDFKKWAYINQFPGTYTGLDDPKFLTDGTFAPEEVQGINTGRNTDWQKLVYKTGLMTNHQVGVTGGTDITQYALSGGYYRETGIYPGQSFERYSLKASVDQQLGKWVKIGVSSLNTYTFTNGENANPMGQVLRASPLSSPYDTTGKLINYFVPGSANQVWNPLANFLPGASVERRKRLGTFNTLYLEVTLAKGLKYRFNAGAELRNDVYGNFYASKTYNNLGGLSTSSNRTTASTNYTLENLLIYDKTIAGKHKINFTGLYSLQEATTQSNQFNNNTILSDNLQYYNPQYASNLTGSGSYSKWDILSYMGRINYSYSDKYLVTLTMRSDGSSRLAPGNKYHTFPSAAAAWNISRENFMQNSHTIANLKLRASYGTVGNTAIDPYQTLGALTAITYNYGSSTTTGAYPTGIANPNLTWEYTTTFNIGADFGLFNNRISGSVDVYKQRTNSLLLPQTLPYSSGITDAVLTNIGKTQNKGIEIHISTVNIQAKGRDNFNWTTDVNFFINRGTITQLANGVTQDVTNNWFVGYPIGAIFDYKRAGIWQNTAADTASAQALGLTTTGTGSVIGQIKVADLNGDKKIDATDRMVLGSNQPKWEGGITNRFSYKGFDFTVVAFARVGGMLASRLFQGNSFVNTFQGNYNNLNVHYWTPDNHENFYPKPTHAQTNPPYGSLLSYYSASFLKIRSLSLGYNLAPSLIKRIGARSFRIYATAQDPFILFSPYRNKYHGIDPETAMSSGAGTGNQGYLNVDTPGTWSMIFGVNVSF